MNKDGVIDFVCIVVPKDPENITEFGNGDSRNDNNISLVVYWGEADRTYKKYKECDNLIEEQDDRFYYGLWDVSVTEKNCMRISMQFSSGAYHEKSSYLIRYQDDKFYVIGSDSKNSDGISSSYREASTNYLTKRCWEKTGTLEDTVMSQKVWRDVEGSLPLLGSGKLQTL